MNWKSKKDYKNLSKDKMKKKRDENLKSLIALQLLVTKIEWEAQLNLAFTILKLATFWNK